MFLNTKRWNFVFNKYCSQIGVIVKWKLREHLNIANTKYISMNSTGVFFFIIYFSSQAFGIKSEVEKMAQITIRLNQKKKRLTGISLSFYVLRTRQKLCQKQKLHRDPCNSRPLSLAI